jgi:hypothetical protein
VVGKVLPSTFAVSGNWNHRALVSQDNFDDSGNGGSDRKLARAFTFDYVDITLLDIFFD